MNREEHSERLQQSISQGGNYSRYSHEELFGQDMWRQLQHVAIPVFSGDKQNHASSKAAFIGCIDGALATPEYKLLQVRQYPSGAAQEAIENL